MSAPETVFETPSQRASFGQMATVFAQLGNMTFGGGSATIAVIHREIVSKRRWTSEENFRTVLCAVASHLRH
jgi:chromate transporter